MPEPLIVACPHCRKQGPWLQTRWKPFCSERCRLVDLGCWFDGAYRVSEPLRPEHFAEFEKLGSEADLDQPAE
jgi:endogenous inhibitor of DNA gyrase (YacG/DUF329 family)